MFWSISMLLRQQTGPYRLCWHLIPLQPTAEQDYHEGYPSFMRWHHRGYYNLADQYNVVIAMQRGHHRRVEHYSLASPEQITDMIHLIDELQEQNCAIDTPRVYTCGLCMGGKKHWSWLANTLMLALLR